MDRYPLAKGDTIKDIHDLLIGRRIVKVERLTVEDGDCLTFRTEYPVLWFDDGSQVVILDEDGMPPIVERVKEPWKDPVVWDGDNA